jgi:predicted ATP-binding protein involved in virulence
MSNFITNIKVNEIYHLKDFNIPISNKEKRHLIITGRNGSGKTILLNAIIEHLTNINTDKNLNFLNYRKNLSTCETNLSNAQKQNDKQQIINAESTVKFYRDNVNRFYGKVESLFNDIVSFAKDLHDNKLIVAFYGDERKSLFNEPKNPVKPNLQLGDDLKNNSKVDQFINFMVDCKVQAALALNEGKSDDAGVINQWFDNFQKILRRLFSDKKLTLEFNYKDYTFHINSEGKSFKFTELSAGYSAALDIITDLILKMQTQDSITRAYEKEGVVLIDEIETHLHLEMQKMILPMLTTVFPNVQFIVTTHSPFVLNSLDNAVAYDLEHKQSIENLTEYSYEALTEGYFGVSTESDSIRTRLEQMEMLVNTPTLSPSQEKELEMYFADFDKIPEAVAPEIKAKYLQLKRTWNNKMR